MSLDANARARRMLTIGFRGSGSGWLVWEGSCSFIEKGSVESTHKVPTSNYHTKHCHAAVVPLGGLTHR